MVAAKAGQAIAAPIKARWAGKAMDDAAAKQLAKDFADEGIKPTAGTITQNPKTLRAEANIAARNPHSRVVKWMTGIPQAQMTKGGIRDHISWLRNFSREALRAGTDDGEALHNAINDYLADSGIEDQKNKKSD